MRFTPKYAVSYCGVIHKGGIPFEINPEDAAEMGRHGTVEAPPEPAAEAEPEQPTKRPGRPRKTN